MKLVDGNGFKIEDLVLGRMEKHQFQVSPLPMWKFLDEWERKSPNGFKDVPMKDIFVGIYEYAVISCNLDKIDNENRINNLNEQNLRWHTRAMDLEAQVEQLKIRLQESQPSSTNS